MQSGKLIILDWDDTIFSTSHFNNQGYFEKNELEEKCKMYLSLLEKKAISFINLAKTCGKVCIVTNSISGWVNTVCTRFFPNLLNHLEDIDIVSARTLYENKCPPIKWKIFAMNDCIKKWFVSPEVVTDFVSFGDAFSDRYAAMEVVKKLPSSTVKSVKFVENPTIEQLYKQLHLIENIFPHIITHKDNIDLIMTMNI